VLNLRHLTVLQTPKTGQNDTILGVLFVQMHKMPNRHARAARVSTWLRQEANLRPTAQKALDGLAATLPVAEKEQERAKGEEEHDGWKPFEQEPTIGA
jgi:hypothetical protein